MLQTAFLALAATALTTAPSWAVSSPVRTTAVHGEIDRFLGDHHTPQLLLASAGSGTASWYGPGFHGNRTANGERFDQWAPTAAHPSLPFGTRVRVHNLDNGRSTVVRINDRGPYHGGRVIDLSRGSAETLGIVGSGTARVRLQVLN